MNRSEQASGGGRSQRRSGTGGVREVHSSSNVYWISGLAEGRARKSVGYNPATALMEPFHPRHLFVFPEVDKGGSGEKGDKHRQ